MIPYNKPNVTEKSKKYVLEALEGLHLSGDGTFTQRCHDHLGRLLGGHALITHSGTAALELATILADIGPGDEVIMPSFTFSSTANCVVLRGATPVFIDVRSDTLNIDETLIEAAITPATKAILPVHYAGVCAEMDQINEIATHHNLFVFEDAAQALMSTYKGKMAGALSDAAAFSFHETKNIVAGEGGALFTSNEELHHRAEIIREKGTNRKQFFRGAVDKYTWTDVGSSYLPSELIAAMLFSQLEDVESITNYRLECYEYYRNAFADLSQSGRLELPTIPEHCVGNGHIFHLLLRDETDRQSFIAHMKDHGISTPFHYVPLHSAPAGIRYGRAADSLHQTDHQSARLVRLPIYIGVKQSIEKIVEVALDYF